MKIIYLANVRMPTEKAHGLQIMKMCEAFSALGHEVELVVPKRLNNLPADALAYYGLPAGFKIIKLPCLDLIFLDKILGNLAFWLASITFFIFAKAYLLAKSFDIIYTREEQYIPWFKPAILELHTLPKKIKFYHKFFWRRFRRIVVLTSFLKKSLAAHGLDDKNILVASDGVDLIEFDLKISQSEARKKISLHTDRKLIIYTGHLYGWKGAQTLADAAALLPADAQVVFIGGTAKEIEEFQKKNNKIKNIKIAGFKPHSQIPYYLKAADVLVLPNSGQEKISQFYTSPLKLFEYMASGVPIVASDLPSLREILNENNSILVEPDNSAELAQGIGRVLMDEKLAERVSKQAYDMVQNYSWRKRADRIINFIK